LVDIKWRIQGSKSEGEETGQAKKDNRERTEKKSTNIPREKSPINGEQQYEVMERQPMGQTSERKKGDTAVIKELARKRR